MAFRKTGAYFSGACSLCFSAQFRTQTAAQFCCYCADQAVGL